MKNINLYIVMKSMSQSAIIIFCFLLIAILSCKNDEQNKKVIRNCDCPLPEILSEKIDSTVQKQDYGLEAELKGKVQSTTIKAAGFEVNGQVKGSINYDQITIQVKKVLNDNPYNFEENHKLKVEQWIYCALDKSVCNSNESDEYLLDFRKNGLNEIKKRIIIDNVRSERNRVPEKNRVPNKNDAVKPDIKTYDNSHPIISTGDNATFNIKQ